MLQNCQYPGLLGITLLQLFSLYGYVLGLFLHNILTASELAISVWGCAVWQAGPWGAASGAGEQSAPAYLLGTCQLSSTHAWTSVRLSFVQC